MTRIPNGDPLAFLGTSSGIATLIRSYDWSSTPLGPIAEWSTELKNITSFMLRCNVPMTLLWGPEGIMIYNEAYQEFAGQRHPVLLGSRVLEGWVEVADFNAHVLKTGLAGGTLSYVDQHLVLSRRGEPADAMVVARLQPCGWRGRHTGRRYGHRSRHDRPRTCGAKASLCTRSGGRWNVRVGSRHRPVGGVRPIPKKSGISRRISR